MTKFRRNHVKSNRGSGGGMIVKVGLFSAILVVLFFLFNKGGETFEDSPFVDESEEEFNEEDTNSESNRIDLSIDSRFLPTSTTGEIVERLHYTYSYSEKHEQAEWVAYKLTKKSIQIPNVKRTGDFRQDPQVKKASSSPSDYYQSGYDRGHLVPAGDMAFDKKAMSETFYMSNISPQVRNFNGGIWRELEENVRDWAYKFRELYIVTGPVLNQGVRDKIGDNKVSVPELYFKVILDIAEPEQKAIAFLLPNEVSDKHLGEFAVPIDHIEELTGINFFDVLLDDEIEEQLESLSDINLWEVSDKKHQQRVKKWNKRN